MADEGPVEPPGRSARGRLTDHDRGRLRTPHRLLLGACVLGALTALSLGGFGVVSGAFGLVIVLLGATVGTAVAAAHLAILALVDEFKGRPVATRRAVEALGFFLLALVLMLFVMGAAGAAGTP